MSGKQHGEERKGEEEGREDEMRREEERRGLTLHVSSLSDRCGRMKENALRGPAQESGVCV